MINLYFGNNSYEYPSNWSELTQFQYLALIRLLNRLWSGEMSMCDVRLQWFKQIAGIDGIRVPKRCVDRFADNLLTASRQFNFFYKLDYGSQITHLSPGIRKVLRKTPPDEVLSNSGEIRHARTLDYTYELDASWAANLIPTIDTGGRTYNGWSASVKGGVLSTSMTARQFTCGYDLLQNIASDGTKHTMTLLAALLYGVQMDNTAELLELEALPDVLLSGVIFNFQAFVTYIFASEYYSILWDSKSEGKKDALPASFGDSVYSLCKKGFGDYAEMEQMPLLTYLNIMRTELICGVRDMAAYGNKSNEIADKTGLPIELILKIL